MLRLTNFLRRNGHPYSRSTPPTKLRADAGRALPCRAGGIAYRPLSERQPAANPSEGQLARCVGLVGPLDSARLYDVVVIGAGPGGLATSVYAASEGLSVLAIDCRSFGGQAGASARIENYLGFPTGIREWR